MKLHPLSGAVCRFLEVLSHVLQAESPSGYNGKQNGHRDKYGPALTWEDGTVLYTSDLLERSSYEDVLHS